jgi:hypothetical protein
LKEANSIYQLPTTEEISTWMHTTCRYPIKSTWLKAIKAGIFKEWLMLSKKTVTNYYPETDETPKRHMNQTQKNVRSIKQNKRPNSKLKSTPSKPLSTVNCAQDATSQTGSK